MIKAAENGESRCQERLARIYENGYGGLQQNYEEARKWYTKAMTEESCYKLAMWYQDGLHGTEKDVAKSVKWMRLWAGDGKERSALADLYSKALLQNDAKAQYELASQFKKSGRFPESDSQVMKWTLMAANAGVDDAQHDLSIYYMGGIYTQKDKGKAEKWTRKWAEVDAKREYLLGCQYFQAHFGSSNWDEAAVWFKKAADKGHAESYKSLWLIYALKKDSYEEVKWLIKIADATELPIKDRANAKYRLGNRYATGNGVVKDGKTAVRLWKEAARMGDSEAVKLLDSHNVEY